MNSLQRPHEVRHARTIAFRVADRLEHATSLAAGAAGWCQRRLLAMRRSEKELQAQAMRRARRTTTGEPSATKAEEGGEESGATNCGP
jgi:hypothetical protein